MTTLNIVRRDCLTAYDMAREILLYLDEVISMESPPSLDDVYLRLSSDVMELQDSMLEDDDCDPDDDPDEDYSGCNYTEIRALDVSKEART